MADNYFNINASSTSKDYQIGLPLESGGNGTVGKFWTKKKTGQKVLIDDYTNIDLLYDPYSGTKQIVLSDDIYEFDTDSLFYQIKSGSLCCNMGIDLSFAVDIYLQPDTISDAYIADKRQIIPTSTGCDFTQNTSTEIRLSIDNDRIIISQIITNINNTIYEYNEKYFDAKLVYLTSDSYGKICIVFDPKSTILIPCIIDYKDFTVPSRVFPVGQIRFRGFLYTYEYTPYEITLD